MVPLHDNEIQSVPDGAKARHFAGRGETTGSSGARRLVLAALVALTVVGGGLLGERTAEASGPWYAWNRQEYTLWVRGYGWSQESADFNFYFHDYGQGVCLYKDKTNNSSYMLGINRFELGCIAKSYTTTAADGSVFHYYLFMMNGNNDLYYVYRARASSPWFYFQPLYWS